MQASGVILIPVGAIVSTSIGYIGDVFSFRTTETVVFEAGDSVQFVSLTPINSDFPTNIGKHQLKTHNYTGASSGYVYCDNPTELLISTIRESDAQYRERIIQGIRTLATSNGVSVRLSALSVDHVRDVVLLERPYGPGTGKVIIDVDSVANEATTISAVITAVEAVRPFGSKITAELATKLPVSIYFALSVDPGANLSNIEQLVIANITNYINTLKIGDQFFISRVIDCAMNSSQDIYDFAISSASIGSSAFVKTSYLPNKYEICTPGTISSVSSLNELA
jgi:phage-related baseplate assembly protein